MFREIQSLIRKQVLSRISCRRIKLPKTKKLLLLLSMQETKAILCSNSYHFLFNPKQIFFLHIIILTAIISDRIKKHFQINIFENFKILRVVCLIRSLLNTTIILFWNRWFFNTTLFTDFLMMPLDTKMNFPLRATLANHNSDTTD